MKGNKSSFLLSCADRFVCKCRDPRIQSGHKELIWQKISLQSCFGSLSPLGSLSLILHSPRTAKTADQSTKQIHCVVYHEEKRQGFQFCISRISWTQNLLWRQSLCNKLVTGWISWQLLAALHQLSNTATMSGVTQPAEPAVSIF